MIDPFPSDSPLKHVRSTDRRRIWRTALRDGGFDRFHRIEWGIIVAIASFAGGFVQSRLPKAHLFQLTVVLVVALVLAAAWFRVKYAAVEVHIRRLVA